MCNCTNDRYFSSHTMAEDTASFITATQTVLETLGEMYGVAVHASARNRFNRILPDDLKRWEWTLTTPNHHESILLRLELTQLTANAVLPTFTYTHGPVQLSSVSGHVFVAAKTESEDADAIKTNIAKSAEAISRCFHETPKKRLLRRQKAGSFGRSSFRCRTPSPRGSAVTPKGIFLGQ